MCFLLTGSQLVHRLQGGGYHDDCSHETLHFLFFLVSTVRIENAVPQDDVDGDDRIGAGLRDAGGVRGVGRAEDDDGTPRDRSSAAGDENRNNAHCTRPAQGYIAVRLFFIVPPDLPRAYVAPLRLSCYLNMILIL